jgi:dienelactone hydrolase
MKRVLMILGVLVWAMAVPAQAKVITQRVPYEHQGLKFTGYLAYDDVVQGKRPGVLVVHEWWGLNAYARSRAEKLAGVGYVAFALDMYGEGKVTQHPSEASQWSKQVTANVREWQQRAQAGLDVLMKDPRTDPDRVAAIGYCFGGSTAQQLAYSGAPVKAVVSFHGSLLLPKEDQAGRTRAKILICHGAADPFVPLTAVQDYLGGMAKSGLDWQMIVFSGAKHSFTNPDADKAGVEGVRYNKSADERSWGYMRQFFHEVLGSK